MATQEIAARLQSVVSMDDFPERTAELTKEWVTAGVGLEAVEPILRFMEDHPSTDFGAPGALVHFVERFYSKGYEKNSSSRWKDIQQRLRFGCFTVLSMVRSNPMQSDSL